jgi:transcriptional regulator with XRE-family HTH domain
MTDYHVTLARYEAVGPEHVADVVDAIADALSATDAEIAEATGRTISRQTINGMRGGRVRIRPDKLWPLAAALGVEVDNLLHPDVGEAVAEALKGRRYDRTARRFHLRRTGEPGTGRPRSRWTGPMASRCAPEQARTRFSVPVAVARWPAIATAG